MYNKFILGCNDNLFFVFVKIFFANIIDNVLKHNNCIITI